MFHDFMWGWGWFPWVIIGLIIWLIVNSSNKKNYPPKSGYDYLQQQESAIDILKKRYARGEITKDQFEQMKRDLE